MYAIAAALGALLKYNAADRRCLLIRSKRGAGYRLQQGIPGFKQSLAGLQLLHLSRRGGQLRFQNLDFGLQAYRQVVQALANVTTSSAARMSETGTCA